MEQYSRIAQEQFEAGEVDYTDDIQSTKYDDRDIAGIGLIESLQQVVDCVDSESVVMQQLSQMISPVLADSIQKELLSQLSVRMSSPADICMQHFTTPSSFS